MMMTLKLCMKTFDKSDGRRQASHKGHKTRFFFACFEGGYFVIRGLCRQILYILQNTLGWYY
jgi:hypothetical protein